MKKILLFLIISFVTVNISYSQNESGHRTGDFKYWKQIRMWYDSTTKLFQTRFPILRTIPPVSTDMPLDILLSYVYLDSILRFKSNEDIEYYIENTRSMNDTLRYALKYLYKMNDYDPVRFNQYRIENLINQRLDSTTLKYKSHIRDQKFYLCEKFRKLSKENKKLALYSIFLADYILKVKILEIDSAQKYPNDSFYWRFNTKVQILDTLKGRKFPPLQFISTNELKNNINHQHNFHFQFTSEDYNDLNKVDVFLYKNIDTNFIYKNGFRMRVGQEAIIFLSFINPLIDLEYDYYDIDTEPRYSFNALRIENNIVYDVNKVWSFSIAIPYEEWKQLYLNYINKILNLDF